MEETGELLYQTPVLQLHPGGFFVTGVPVESNSGQAGRHPL
jgi:hypothetical protein